VLTKEKQETTGIEVIGTAGENGAKVEKSLL
jgi:hypothetical protein